MSFREFRDEVRAVVGEALARSDYSPVGFDVLETPRPELGDLSVNVAFRVGKRTGKRPSEVAQDIGRHLELGKNSLIGTFEIHGTGYINFKMKYAEFAFQVLTRAEDRRRGALNLGHGKRVIVEHTSVNPNKALHVGHLRNVVLGDSISRILRYTGHNTFVLNYIDDSGAQVADIIVGFQHLHFPSEVGERQEKFDHYCGDTVYVKVNELYESDPGLLEKRKEILKKMEDPTSDIATFAHKITKRILMEQLKTCWRVGAIYDCLNFESHILELKLWDEIFALLKKKGIVTCPTSGEFQDCWIIKVEGEEEGEEKVLVRSDGTATYIAKDIPYAAWKIGVLPDRFNYSVFTQQPGDLLLWSTSVSQGTESHPSFGGADMAITVIDVRQSRLQRIISYILSQLSNGDTSGKYFHLGYEVVSLNGDTANKMGINVDDHKFLHMSGRKGIYINADDVLNALHNRSYDETKLRNKDESEEWLRLTAEKVAIAAIRFSLLKQDVDKMITFDLSEALNLEGETGPYIQYAYARASRILDKSEGGKPISQEDASSLQSQTEVGLIKKISKFDIFVEDAVKNLSPKTIARYAFDLAESFNAFYEKNPVLQEQDEGKKSAKLTLVKAFRNTTKEALCLLGIEALDRI